MVSVVPSIIPILTANAVAANQTKKQKKVNVSKEKKLKDSPLNDKINCRVFLNNGNVIEGHYEGNWYEDNSDEEGIWIKTDNGTEEINSKDYDRVEYYHKKPLKEAYIKAEKGNIYYTKNSDMFLSMVKSIFISKNIPVRVYYDTIKQMYVFGDATNYIHADLATGMKYHSNVYGTYEMRANISYLKQNCALFQVLPNDDFKKYDMGDGYSQGWFLKLDDLIFACRNKEYHKVRDEVPLFKDHIGEWMDVQYYLSKKNNINESVENNTDEKLNSKNNCKIILKDGKIIYGKLLSVNENYVYINSDNGNRIKKDNIKELYMYYDCEVITKNGKTIYGNFVGDFGDHKLHLDDSFNRKGWAIKDEMIEKINYKKVIKHTFNTDTLNETVEPELNDNFWKWFGNSKVVDEQGKPLVVYHGWNKDFKEFILQDKDVKGIKCAFFSSDIDTAGSYSEFGNVKDFYLRIENPYIYDAGNSQYYIGKDTNHIIKALSEAQKGNYDGVIVKNIRDDSYQEYEEGYELPYSTTYIVFNPNQIKSVNNNGEWSMTSNNINESVEDKILYIIRGVPGSGKSTLAHKLTDNVVEADQYFYDDKGNYNWSADKLNQAHNWCYNTVKKYMEEGRDKIAVANTFVKNKDYKRYVELAKDFNYKVVIKTCTGNYKNIHNVPDETVERMRSKFQETPLDESVKLKNKYVFPEPDWGNLNELIDPNDRYRYWVDGVQAKIEKPYKENIPVNKIRQDYDGEDICDYDYDQFDNGIDTPIEVLKYRDQYILMDGHHRAAYAKEKGLKTILAYVWDADKLEQVDESAENDKTLRDYATELANICLDALVKTKYETHISYGQVQINVDKAFKKAVPMLKNSPYEYFLLLVSEKDEPNPSFGKANDNKYGVIMFPIFSSDPSDLALSILYKHKSVLEKLYTTYSGDELKLKIHEYAVKYLKNEIKKRLESKKNTYLGLLIHECTHLLDDVRRTKTYNKSKEQNLKDDKGIETYYNSPEEQNAYYQETVSIFDQYAENKLVGYKTFDVFWDDFIRQYKGEYNLLNDKNKRRLKKRAYAYWYVYMKD